MHEAREGIINRLAMTLPHTINLDRFLTVIVSELGRMMNVDRCDVIQLNSASELRISHEWRASNDVPSSLGNRHSAQRQPALRTRRYPQADSPERYFCRDLNQKVRFLAASLGTRSLLVVPVMLGDDVLGLVGLHTTRTRVSGSTTKSRFWNRSPGRSRSDISTRALHGQGTRS